MSAWNLPTSICIAGEEYEIRSDFRAVIDILIACSDPELTDYQKMDVMLDILYVEDIPLSGYEEACQKACEFIDAGVKPDSKPKHRLMDWEQDASIVIPAVNKVAGMEVRSVPYLHWWTFLGYFMEIGESLFSQVVSIRQKKAKHQKLDKWERDWERENASIVRLEHRESEESKRERESIEKWL